LRAILVVAELAGVAAAVYFWGSVGVWSWIVAALAQRGLTNFRLAVHAPTGQEQVAGALALLVICALIALIARRGTSASHPEEAGA
jgi:hypothetical protein